METNEERVLAFIREQNDRGATDYELEQALGLKHQTVSPSRLALVHRGLIHSSGEVRKTDSDRDATVWIASPLDIPVLVFRTALGVATVSLSDVLHLVTSAVVDDGLKASLRSTPRVMVELRRLRDNTICAWDEECAPVQCSCQGGGLDVRERCT
jgi:hypothetical protein